MLQFISIGSDPEVFVTYKKEVISAEGLIGGSKAEPREIEDGYCVQEDNVLLEYNIPVCYTKPDFVEAIHKGLTLGKLVLSKDYDISIIASNVMDPKWLQTPHAQEFGCDPDFNAHTESMNEKPNSQTNLRTAGGHIHIGYETTSIDSTLQLVKMCDLFLGVPSILMDSDSMRRLLYGKAGCFRFREYGFEYRTLSNYWLKSKDDTAWIYDQIKKMFEFVNHGGYGAVTEKDWSNIIMCINDSNTDLAIRICNKFSTL